MSRLLTRRSMLTSMLATGISTPAIAGSNFDMLAAFTDNSAEINALAQSLNGKPSVRPYSGKRRLHGFNPRTSEWLDIDWDGQFELPDEQFKLFLRWHRDWRENKENPNTPKRLVEVMADTHRLLDTRKPYDLTSGYRALKTNNWLRSIGVGAAQNSLHIKGQAADLSLSNRTPDQVGKAGRAAGAGGVGVYPGSHFAHLDVGSKRTWRG